MRNLIIGLVIGSSVSIIGNELTMEQKQRAAIYQLKIQLANCQLNKEQSDLINEFKLTLDPKTGQEFDWLTLTFKDKEK